MWILRYTEYCKNGNDLKPSVGGLNDRIWFFIIGVFSLNRCQLFILLPEKQARDSPDGSMQRMQGHGQVRNRLREGSVFLCSEEVECENFKHKFDYSNGFLLL